MRPQVVTVGPLATADADGIGISQKAAGAQYLVLSGDLSDEAATAVCATQTPSGAGALTINGTKASGGIAYFNLMRRVYITSAGDDSSRTFVITGTGVSPGAAGGGPAYFGISETVTGANASMVSTSKEFWTVTGVTIVGGGAAGAVTVGMSGVGTMDTPRRVIITSGGDDTDITFTITGTDYAGLKISEVLTGASGGAAQSALDYLTVTSVLTSAAAGTTVTIGTNGVASSPWAKFDPYAAIGPVSIQVVVSAAGANYTVQQTLDDPNATPSLVTPATATWFNHDDSNLVSATANKQGNWAYQPAYGRVTLNSGTGSATGTFIQAGLF